MESRFRLSPSARHRLLMGARGQAFAPAAGDVGEVTSEQSGENLGDMP